MKNEKMKGKLIEALPGVPESFWDNRPFPESKEGIKGFAKDVSTDYKAVLQDLADRRSSEPASQVEIDKLVSNIMPSGPDYKNDEPKKEEPKKTDKEKMCEKIVNEMF